MKGIILAGGNGTRLRPLTKITSKLLMPVYDKPVIFYPIQTMIDAGIDEILIVTCAEHVKQFYSLLGFGEEFGVKLEYIVQEPKGTAYALLYGERFVDDQNLMMIFGDNLLEHNFANDVQNFESGGVVFAKEVDDPRRYGVVAFDGDKVISIEEKPENPKSNYAIVGAYLFDNSVFDYAKKIELSSRGEYELTDVINIYLKEENLKVKIVEGMWEDVGTYDSLLRASNYFASRNKK